MTELKDKLTKLLVKHLEVKKVKKNGTIIFKFKKGTEQYTDEIIEVFKDLK